VTDAEFSLKVTKNAVMHRASAEGLRPVSDRFRAATCGNFAHTMPGVNANFLLWVSLHLSAPVWVTPASISLATLHPSGTIRPESQTTPGQAKNRTPRANTALCYPSQRVARPYPGGWGSGAWWLPWGLLAAIVDVRRVGLVEVLVRSNPNSICEAVVADRKNSSNTWNLRNGGT
jgi:hypothetical protein